GDAAAADDADFDALGLVLGLGSDQGRSGSDGAESCCSLVEISAGHASHGCLLPASKLVATVRQWASRSNIFRERSDCWSQTARAAPIIPASGPSCAGMMGSSRVGSAQMWRRVDSTNASQ